MYSLPALVWSFTKCITIPVSQSVLWKPRALLMIHFVGNVVSSDVFYFIKLYGGYTCLSIPKTFCILRFAGYGKSVLLTRSQ